MRPIDQWHLNSIKLFDYPDRMEANGIVELRPMTSTGSRSLARCPPPPWDTY